MRRVACCYRPKSQVAERNFLDKNWRSTSFKE
jgi:hypothetical protein